MQSRQRAVVILRWIQWALSAFSIGVCITYFLVNINFYLWIPAIFRAQVGLTGFIHIYLWLAAIWVSVKPQGYLTWAVLDIVFGLLAAGAIGTSQPSISEYCSKSSFTLYWSDTNFAYVPLDLRSSSDKSDLTQTFTSSYLTRACGMNAGVVVANGLLMSALQPLTYHFIKLTYYPAFCSLSPHSYKSNNTANNEKGGSPTYPGLRSRKNSSKVAGGKVSLHHLHEETSILKYSIEEDFYDSTIE